VLEAFAVPQSDCYPIAKRIQKIVFSFAVLVADPKAFDLVDQVIARFAQGFRIWAPWRSDLSEARESRDTWLRGRAQAGCYSSRPFDVCRQSFFDGLDSFLQGREVAFGSLLRI
jgi:hypothetical protein